MATFEQAIFTSARTQQGEGYHLTSRSAGISSDLSRELSRWGPSHDCLVEHAQHKRSINFFRSSDGSLCTSVTVSAGVEHSGRAGERMHTHFLIATEAAMLEFANDPFALVRAADALGVFDSLEADRGELPGVTLAGHSVVVDADLLMRATARLDVGGIVRLLSACLSESWVAFASADDSEFVVQALLHLLPVGCRRDVSFSTALKHSPRREFRLLVAPNSKTQQRRLERTFNTTVVDLAASGDQVETSANRWVAMVAEHLADGRITELAEAVANYRECVFDQSLVNAVPAVQSSETAAVGSLLASDPALAAAAHARTDAAHAQHAIDQLATPRQLIGAEHGEVMDRLGQLDDAVFDAIAGNAEALDRLQQLWPKFRHEFNRPLVEESKEQYLSYVVQQWKEHTATGDHKHTSATTLLDIVSLLFDAE